MKKTALLFALLILTISCAKAPPDLTPEATVAFHGTQAVRALDILRDTAISANAQVPPLLSEADTRKVVLYHQSTVKVIQTSPTGWKSAAETGLNELMNNLPPPQQSLLAPYVSLIRTILKEVTR